jgi:hypothetical protein
MILSKIILHQKSTFNQTYRVCEPPTDYEVVEKSSALLIMNFSVI